MEENVSNIGMVYLVLSMSTCIFILYQYIIQIIVNFNCGLSSLINVGYSWNEIQYDSFTVNYFFCWGIFIVWFYLPQLDRTLAQSRSSWYTAIPEQCSLDLHLVTDRWCEHRTPSIVNLVGSDLLKVWDSRECVTVPKAVLFHTAWFSPEEVITWLGETSVTIFT